MKDETGFYSLSTAAPRYTYTVARRLFAPSLESGARALSVGPYLSAPSRSRSLTNSVHVWSRLLRTLSHHAHLRGAVLAFEAGPEI